MSIVADCKVKGLSNPFKDSVFMATATLGESTKAATAALVDMPGEPPFFLACISYLVRNWLIVILSGQIVSSLS